MEYAKVENGKIIAIVDTDNPDKLQESNNNEGIEGRGEWLVDKPMDGHNQAHVGDNIKKFDKNWRLRPAKELESEGLLELTKASEGDGVPIGTILEKVDENGCIVKKSEYDLVKEGAKELGSNQYLDEDNKEVKEGDLDTLLKVGRIDEKEHRERLASQIRAERNSRINNIEWRYARYASEERLGKETTDSLEDLDRYMQALRDVPQQDGFPYKVDWPKEP